MIGRLTGLVAECTPGSVLLDVGGVGYRLQIPLSTFYALQQGGNGAATLFVHTHVREDALQLFGFSTAGELAAFEKLIAVSGVGPRTALAVLSGIGVADLERAVLASDRAKLERIPGIGRKTAERVILELRDRIEGEGGARGRRRGAAGLPPSAEPEESGVRGDAVSALRNLGYPGDAASRAVDEALRRMGPDTTLGGVLRDALRGLVR